MDERCKICPYVCKRLDGDDQPKRYFIANLRPEQVTKLIETALCTEHSLRNIQVEQFASSAGNQLVMLLQPTYAAQDSEHIVFIAQGEPGVDAATEVWFRYGVPEQYCGTTRIADFTGMVDELLAVLRDIDRRLGGQRQDCVH